MDQTEITLLILRKSCRSDHFGGCCNERISSIDNAVVDSVIACVNFSCSLFLCVWFTSRSGHLAREGCKDTIRTYMNECPPVKSVAGGQTDVDLLRQKLLNRSLSLSLTELLSEFVRAKSMS